MYQDGGETMQYTRLGSTGATVSRLCLGCMSYGAPGWDAHPWVLDKAAAMPHFRLAAEKGINFFDTADHYSYGESERVVGAAIREYFTRDEVVIATKVGFSTGKGLNRTGLSRKHIVQSVEASLRRLGTDHIDLLYTHRFDPETEVEEMLGALDLLVRQGKVIYLGACSAWAWQFAKLREMQKANGMATFQVMQNFYNLVYREEEREMIPYLQHEGLAMVPWSPIARGFLAGLMPRGAQADDPRARQDRVLQSYFGSDADYAVLDAVQRAAGKHGVTSAQIAYAWVLSKGFVTAPVAGATEIAHLEQCVAALDIRLDGETLADLEAAYQPHALSGQIQFAGRHPLVPRAA